MGVRVGIRRPSPRGTRAFPRANRRGKRSELNKKTPPEDNSACRQRGELLRRSAPSVGVHLEAQVVAIGGDAVGVGGGGGDDDRASRPSVVHGGVSATTADGVDHAAAAAGRFVSVCS